MICNNVLLNLHTELGDLFICEGLIRQYAKFSDRVYFTTRYASEARLLFADLDGAVQPVTVERILYPTRHDVQVDVPVHKLYFGYYHEEFQKHGKLGPDGLYTFDKVHWDREFYRQAGMSFLSRWSASDLPNPYEFNPPSDVPSGSVLVHDDSRFPLSGVEGIRIGKRKTIFDWMLPISKAKEVHCIDSSVLNLVESMWANGYLSGKTRLHYHAAVRKSDPPTLLAPWRVHYE